ncbi:MAG: hypothetical protein NkDv07_0532 [Candidatus Improbicoccus devescovinae]|nr:MAG: hypothetical protein NkDv07_0492 [Candidatus Improbicoccus devescovinae]GMB10653.1 MAG: hypothetical protein NkDv07_0532 [Candidatus Improbicoccus devescovinae]
MSDISEERLQELKDLAKLLAVNGVRNNTELENLHAGRGPSSVVGDYSDIKALSPYGEIEWNRLSRISDKEMRSLMLSIERALENTLISYEKADQKTKKDILKFFKIQRSYDYDISCSSSTKI